MIARVHHALISALAMLAGVLMFAMMAVIILDVSARNLGTQGSAHFFTFTEYALLLVTLLGAPWLVRERGHIYVEIALMYLPEATRRKALRLVATISALICALLAWYALAITLQNYQLGDMDVRSLDMPRWMLMVFMPLSFAAMAIEFAKFVVSGKSMYDDAMIHSS